MLRRVEPNRFFNLDGHGRGAGWAGNVTIEPSVEPLVSKALSDGVHRKRSGVPFKVFGPYWAKEAAAATSGDDLAVFGGEGVAGLTDDELRAYADRAAAAARPIPKEKTERDEAEVSQALADLLGFRGSTIADAAQHLAAMTARALSCEFGAVLLLEPETRVFTAHEGWFPVATEDEVIAALMPLHQAAMDGIYVEDDVARSPFPYPPLSFADGLVARCCVPLGEGGRLGVLLAAHAGSAPRGFTMLCRRVAGSMAEAGEELLGGR